MEDNHSAAPQASAKIYGTLALLLTAMIWGSAFVAQRMGAAVLAPQVFTALRSFIGAAALLPVIAMLDRLEHRPIGVWGSAGESAQTKKTLLTGGICCGCALSAASLLQQWGITFASAGKSGFLTALYIVIVPVLGIFFHRKTTWLLWIAVVLALAGSVMLSYNGGSIEFDAGSLLLIGCAFAFSIHILVIDHFAPLTDCVRMSCIQFFVTGMISTVFALITGDSWDLQSIFSVIGAVLYCGICSSGIAYTLQIVGQKYVHPVTASLLMSLESVFALLSGIILLNERFSVMELTGCAIIFCAVVLAQIPLPGKKQN